MAFKTRRANLAALPDYLKPPMTFAYLTGWRSSAVLGLKWANIDFRAQEIRLEVKSGSTR